MILRPCDPAQRMAAVAYIAERLCETPEDLIGTMPFEVLTAVGADAKVKGAVLYGNYRNVSIEMTCAGEPGWLTRGNLRVFFGYPFDQLKCRRVTAIVHSANAASQSMCERLGFKREGLCEHGFADGDAVIYGMIKSNCRWIR